MGTLKTLIITSAGFTVLAGISYAALGDDMASQQPEMKMDQVDGPSMLGEGMLAIPQMDSARGRRLFASKGCVVCHSINGVGGEDAPPLDVTEMQPMMNPFEFAAKMWRGAGAMVALQQDELGAQIELTGQELADIIAFAHSHEEQAKFTHDDIPADIEKKMMHDE